MSPGGKEEGEKIKGKKVLLGLLAFLSPPPSFFSRGVAFDNFPNFNIKKENYLES